jgi:hypothetical protein
LNIKKRVDEWIFNRNLKIAKRKFEAVRKSSPYNAAPVMERRKYIKEILSVAFKSIRIKER